MTHTKLYQVWLLLAFALFVNESDADSLEERFGDAHEDLPDTLVFDCSTSSSSGITVFDSTMLVPANFQVAESNTSRLEWSVPLGTGLVAVYFSTIDTGESEYFATKSYDWPSISEHSENSLGVRITLFEPKPDAKNVWYELILVRGDEYLQVGSAVPIDVNSLFACFR